MSHRLQVLVPEALDRRIRKAADRSRLSAGAWVRQAIERARGGDVDICTSTEVLQEILYRYSALKRLDLAASVYDLFVHLCPTVLPVALADTDRDRALLVSSRGISVRDAVHAASC